MSNKTYDKKIVVLNRFAMRRSGASYSEIAKAEGVPNWMIREYFYTRERDWMIREYFYTRERDGVAKMFGNSAPISQAIPEPEKRETVLAFLAILNRHKGVGVTAMMESWRKNIGRVYQELKG